MNYDLAFDLLDLTFSVLVLVLVYLGTQVAARAGYRAWQRRSLRVPGVYETTYTPPDLTGKGLAFFGDTLTEFEIPGVSIALAEFFYSVKQMVRA
jgi:hypothetical protein